MQQEVEHAGSRTWLVNSAAEITCFCSQHHQQWCWPLSPKALTSRCLSELTTRLWFIFSILRYLYSFCFFSVLCPASGHVDFKYPDFSLFSYGLTQTFSGLLFILLFTLNVQSNLLLRCQMKSPQFRACLKAAVVTVCLFWHKEYSKDYHRYMSDEWSSALEMVVSTVTCLPSGRCHLIEAPDHKKNSRKTEIASRASCCIQKEAGRTLHFQILVLALRQQNS